MNERTKRILLFPITTIAILLLLYFGGSILAYQLLINEGSVLADNQCLKVNPIIIDRKNAYIKSMQALKDNDLKTYEKETDKYLAASNKYVQEQESWLKAQKKFIDRWDFQYFNPSYVKEAAMTQFVSRVADVESTKLLVEAFYVKDLNMSIAEEDGKKAMDQIKLRNAADKKYDEIWDNPGKLDWRTKFIKVPPSKCPDENFNIPNVDDFLNPESTPANPDAPIT